MSLPNNAYVYREYIDALLNYASSAKTSHLTSCLWDMNIPDYMDDMLDSSNPNMALQRRAQYIQGNHTLDLIGHFHFDVFNQDKFLNNGVEVRMRLVRSKNSFCLMESKMINTNTKNMNTKNTHSRCQSRKKSKNKPGCATRTC